MLCVCSVGRLEKNGSAHLGSGAQSRKLIPQKAGEPTQDLFARNGREAQRDDLHLKGERMEEREREREREDDGARHSS